MPKETLRILGINPGTIYLGLAVFIGPELRDWGIKGLKGRWSQEKARKIRDIIAGYLDRYEINALSIKKLHPARCSVPLQELVTMIVKHCHTKKIRVQTYSIQELEALFSDQGRINRKELAEIIVRQYPALFHELEKERKNKNPYFFRLFETVALGAACYYQNENK